MKKISKINIAFDISTQKTGYAILFDGVPIRIIDENRLPLYSFGSVAMLNKKVNFDTYGDRMAKASHHAVDTLASLIFKIGQNLRDKGANQEIDLNKIQEINIVFEISGIPNFANKGAIFASINSTQKLGLYTGLIFGRVAQSLFLTIPLHFQKIKFKLISPNEWQHYLMNKWEKKSIGSKKISIKKANEYLKKIGINTEIKDDDTADALNIAILADKVRDTLGAKNDRNKKTKYY